MLKLKQPERPEININEGIEQRIKVASAEISKGSAEEAVSLTMRELDTKLGGSGSGSRIKDIIARAKKEGGITDNISCPNCKDSGHNHSLKDIGGGKLKCTGEDCEKEYSLIPSDAEYYCTSCQTPHSKPKTKEEQDSDFCPHCGNKEFMKIDYSKIRNKVAKKKKK